MCASLECKVIILILDCFQHAANLNSFPKDTLFVFFYFALRNEIIVKLKKSLKRKANGLELESQFVYFSIALYYRFSS